MKGEKIMVLGKNEFTEKGESEAAQLGEALFHNDYFGVVVVDAQYCIKRANDKLCEIFASGKPISLIGARIDTLFYKKDIFSELKQRYDLMISSPPATPVHYKIRRKDGEEMAISIQPVCIDKQSPPDLLKGVLWMVYDMNKEPKIEPAQPVVYEKVVTPMDTANIGIIYCENGVITKCNNYMVKLLGYKSEEALLGVVLADLYVKDESCVSARDALYESVKMHRSECQDIMLYCDSGDPIWVSVSGNAVDNATPADLDKGVVWMYRDLQEVKNLEKELRKRNEELIKLNKKKDLFISILAHDLKGPIGASFYFLEELLEDIEEIETEELHSNLRLICNSMKKTYKLLEDVLYWTRAQLGLIKPHIEKVDICTICEEIREQLEERATRKGITIRWDNTSYPILVDKGMINAVVRNLISNAIKFSYPKSVIDIIVQQRKDCAEISVKDTGVGISEERIKKLWDITVNSPSTRGTADEDGTGMGLRLVKQLTNIMEGDIKVESKVGVGSIFTVAIPIAKD